MIQYDAQRWTDHLFDLRGSVIREIAPRVLICTLIAVAAWLVDREIEALHHKSIEIPATAHSLIGTALGLLLAMRTNSSYERFWEGRKMWGAIVNETRNLGRSASVLLAKDPAVLRQVLLWTIAFPWSTERLLRGAKGLGPRAAELPADQAAAALASVHPPLFITRRITALLAEARARGTLGDMQQMSLDQVLTLLIDYMGACERIMKTPLPYAYAVHLRRAMIVFCFTLPFVLVHSFHWATIPATLLVAFTFFGIEEIGLEIENPFGHDENDLPLEAICETIQRDLSEIIDQTTGGPPAAT